jgi:C_GCAxxG_C_C family probable redox protein
MCGALSGAILGVSLVKGRRSPEEPMDPLYANIQELMRKFKGRFGSTTCRSLIQIDISTEEGRAAYGERGLHSQCSEYIAEATRLAMKLLAD